MFQQLGKIGWRRGVPGGGMSVYWAYSRSSSPYLAPRNLGKRSPVASTFVGDAPAVPPKGRWPSLRLGTKCPSLAFALDNQDIPHNYVQQSVIFTTKLDALTLVKQVGEKLPDAPSIEDIP